ncbi:MAG: DUF167 domain-containing protein [Bacillota bacterium]
MRLLVKVIPRASKNELAGWSGDILRVKVAAPPVDGQANAAPVRFIRDERSGGGRSQKSHEDAPAEGPDARGSGGHSRR